MKNSRAKKFPQLGTRASLAMLVVDNQTGEVLARVGSVDFNDMERAGRIDMTRGVRSPGSALKPFIYGLAFEDGVAHPETLIEDRPTRFANWRPENFDLTFHGTVYVAPRAAAFIERACSRTAGCGRPAASLCTA